MVRGAKRWHSRRLADELTDPELQQALNRLANDEVIGPLAPGDGDLIEWWGLALQLILAEISYRVSSGGALLNDFSDDELASPADRSVFDVRGACNDEFLAVLNSAAWDGFFSCWPNASPDMATVFRDLNSLLQGEISVHWGGRRVRLSIKPKTKNPLGVVSRLLAAGTPIADIPRLSGVSRATVYRVMGKRQR